MTDDADDVTAKKKAAKKTTSKKKSKSKASKKAVSKKAAENSIAAGDTSTDANPGAKVKASTKKRATKNQEMKADAKLAVVDSNDVESDETDGDTELPVSSQPPVIPYERSSSGHYLSDEQHEYFREKLLTWKQQLMEEVDRTVGHMKDDATNFPDPNDRATQEEEFSLELRTRDRERKLIKKINEALKRLDDDEYGYCLACGIEIGYKRLDARPTAELCIDCKTLEEIRERQTA